MSHLKHAASGHLLHGPAGNLVRDCGAAPCACPADSPCDWCADATPSQFHVTFTDVSLCPDCVSCADAGFSLRMNDGSALDGTYLLARNGSCAWTAFSTSVPCSATLDSSTDCTGDGAPVGFAILLVRINSSQFRLQVTDDTNTILLFDAIVDAADCCAAYSVDNDLTDCGCVVGDTTTITAGTGGSATVTPC
jgi:hypothetical protein